MFETEPLRETDYPPLTHPKAVETHQIGFVTEDETDLPFAVILDQLNADAPGEPIHMINPEVWRG